MSELNRREMSRRGLLGSDEGWSLAPVAAWLAIEGRLIRDPVTLLNALGTQLDAAGARIDRIGLTLGTTHPQILAWGIFWTRGRGAAEFARWHGLEHSDAYIGSPVQFVREQKRPFRRRLEALDPVRDHAVLHELHATGLTDYVALPLVFGSGAINFLTLATAAPHGFSDNDLDRLDALSNLLAPVVEILHARRLTLGLLDTFVGPRIGTRILEGQVKRGDGDRIEAAFWYSDLRGFTALSESLPPTQLLQPNVGSPNRLAFNVVGPAVNKTARLQSMTKETGAPLLLSKEFAALIRRPIRSIGHFDLRGIGGPQEMFTIGEEV
jgi:hypothetical protein